MNEPPPDSERHPTMTAALRGVTTGDTEGVKLLLRLMTDEELVALSAQAQDEWSQVRQIYSRLFAAFRDVHSERAARGKEQP